MARKVTLSLTTKRNFFHDDLVYVTSPETHSTLLRVPAGEGTYVGAVEIMVIDAERYPEGSDPPFEVHRLVETWPGDRLVVESSSGLSQREIHSLFPELYAEDDEYDRLPTPKLSSVARQLDTDVSGGPIGVWERSDQMCPWCGTNLVSVFDLDLGDVRLAFLGVDGKRLRALTCSGCVCYGPIYAQLDVRGTASWWASNERPSHLPSGPSVQLQACRAAPGTEIRQPKDRDEALAVDAIEGNESHIGGRPRWVQYWAYPSCPTCGELMPFLGQVDLGDPPWSDEGTYYTFLDLGCGVACTSYQQT